MSGSALILETEIKRESLSDIIDLDENRSPEDLIYEWAAEVREKFKYHASAESEQQLNKLMIWYIKSLKEEAIYFADYQMLKVLMDKHLEYFELYCLELNCYFMDNYLDNMEEILSFYVNLLVKLLPAKQKDCNKVVYKRQISSVCQKVIYTLNKYLFNREDHMCHVVMRLKLNPESEENRNFFNFIYGHFATKEPKSKSDLEFCRAYILYQKWKTIRKPKEWEKMDKIMYSLHDRTQSSIKLNPVLRQILLSQSNSVLDTLINVSEKFVQITDGYFKYIKSCKIQEDNAIATEIASIEIDDDDDDVVDISGDVEDRGLEDAYKDFVVNISSKDDRESDDEDCQIVSVYSQPNISEDAYVLREILDEEMEIVYFKKKEDDQNVPQAVKNDSTSVSFLDSIAIEDDCEEPFLVSSSTNDSDTTKIISLDSPTSSPVKETNTTSFKTDVISSVVQTNPIPETPAVPEPIQPSVEPGSTRTIETSTATEEVTDSAEPGPSGVKTKNMITTETQTEDWQMNEKTEKQSDRSSVCSGSYPYCYGIVTPPSDQPPDDHKVTESTTYPKVYTNFVRSSTPDENGSLAKATETDFLPSSIEENDMECPNVTEKKSTDPDGYSRNHKYDCSIEGETYAKPKAKKKKKHKKHRGSHSSKRSNRSKYDITENSTGYELNDSSCSKLANISVKSLDECREEMYPETTEPIPEISTNSCTSPDYIDTSEDFASKEANSHFDEESTSPDVTSTSTDVQTFDRHDSVANSSSYAGSSEIESNYTPNGSYCLDEYSECVEETVNQDNITQSNLEDGEEEICIEDTMLMGSGEDLTYIVNGEENIAEEVCLDEPQAAALSHDFNSIDNIDSTQKDSASDRKAVERTEIEDVRLDDNRLGAVRFTMPLVQFSHFEDTIGAYQYEETVMEDDFEQPSTPPPVVQKCSTVREKTFESFINEIRSVDRRVQSPGEIPSPAFEDATDFSTYYEKSKNQFVHSDMANFGGSSRHTNRQEPGKSLKRPSDAFSESYVEVGHHNMPKRTKRVKISATVSDSSNSAPHSPSDTVRAKPGILKNANKQSVSSLALPQYKNVLRSTASKKPSTDAANNARTHHKQPTQDPSLLLNECRVLIHKLPPSVINGMEKINALCKNIEQPQTIIRVDYKDSADINNGLSQGGPLPSRVCNAQNNRLDEGMVNSSFDPPDSVNVCKTPAYVLYNCKGQSFNKPPDCLNDDLYGRRNLGRTSSLSAGGNAYPPQPAAVPDVKQFMATLDKAPAHPAFREPIHNLHSPDTLNSLNSSPLFVAKSVINEAKTPLNGPKSTPDNRTTPRQQFVHPKKRLLGAAIDEISNKPVNVENPAKASPSVPNLVASTSVPNTVPSSSLPNENIPNYPAKPAMSIAFFPDHVIRRPAVPSQIIRYPFEAIGDLPKVLATSPELLNKYICFVNGNKISQLFLLSPEFTNNLILCHQQSAAD